MVFALSGSHEVGLAIAGGIFVIFSLLSAFVFPRSNPDFPGGKGLRWYLPLCVLIFVGMITSVLYFGRDEKKASAAAATTAVTTAPSTAAAVTSGPYANGNAAAGKTVFLTTAAPTCGTCHTMTAAGSTGTLGPNLNDVAAYAAKAHLPLGQFLIAAITKPPAPYVPPGFAPSMPSTFATSLSATQIADLIQFIASSASG